MKEYGLRITDIVGAKYTRWFNTDGHYVTNNGISTALLELGEKLNGMSLRKAIKHAQKIERVTSFKVEVLFEKDFI